MKALFWTLKATWLKLPPLGNKRYAMPAEPGRMVYGQHFPKVRAYAAEVKVRKVWFYLSKGL